MININNKNYTLEEFKDLVANSKAKTDLSRKLGYTYTSGTLWKFIYKFIEEYKISIEHFDTKVFKRQLRGFDKEISKEDLNEQLELFKSLSQLAKHFNCSQTNIRYWIGKFGLKLKRGAKGKKPKDFITARSCKCGETDPSKFYGNKTTICGKCHNINNHAKGKENRAYILNKMGNKCYICGYDKYKSALDVHHLDPNIKDSNFNTIRYWNREKIDKEIEKCVLLCRCCHAGFHSGELIDDRLKL